MPCNSEAKYLWTGPYVDLESGVTHEHEVRVERTGGQFDRLHLDTMGAVQAVQSGRVHCFFQWIETTTVAYLKTQKERFLEPFFRGNIKAISLFIVILWCSFASKDFFKEYLNKNNL